MITKITNDNKALYRVLFDKAATQINADVNSLDEYFAVLHTLAQSDSLYTRLPLDEPPFDIDADKRTIEVPFEFKKNGISVQGDEISEIIYFRVDRYFDAIDLAQEDMHIAIQWETAPDASKQTVKGISKECLRDITTYATEDKMIFGWALNSNITKNPGNIKFAVRFYKVANSKITFSLSTLTQTATINAALDYKFVDGQPTYNVQDDTNTVLGRLVNSATPSGTVAAQTPYFIVDALPEHTAGAAGSDCYNEATINGVVYHYIDLEDNRVADDAAGVVTNSSGYLVEVEAGSDDAGKISYEWYQVGESASLGSGTTVYRVTTDTKVANKKVYYTKDTTVTPAVYKSIALTVGADIITDTEDANYKGVIYEKMNAYDIQHTGDFFVKAVNMRGIATSSLKSKYLRVPGPGTPVITPETNINATTGAVKVILDATSHSATLSANATTGISGDKLSFSWATPDVEGSTPVVHNATVSDALQPDTLAVTVDAANVNAYDVTYVVTVAASRNGDTTAALSRPTQTYRVTGTAVAPSVSANNTNVSGASEAELSIGVTATAPTVSDSLTYQWCKKTSAVGDDETIAGATNASYTVPANHAGVYYCVVTNHVNGTSASATCDDISIART